MSDKRIGYCILAASLVIMLSLAALSIRILAFPKETRHISFAMISNLRIDDPVTVRGKQLGRVKNIAAQGSRVLITVELNEELPLYAGYRIYTTDKGILGDRMIVIRPGESSGTRINPNDTLNGLFFPGVSDVIGQAWKLADFITSFKTNFFLLVTGTEEKEPLAAIFSQILGTIDTLSAGLFNAVRFLETGLTPGLDSVAVLVTYTDSLITEIKEIIPQQLTTVETQLDALAAFILKLDAIVTSMNGIVARLHAHELLSVDHLTPLQKQLTEVERLLKEVLDGAGRLKLKISAGF